MRRRARPCTGADPKVQRADAQIFATDAAYAKSQATLKHSLQLNISGFRDEYVTISARLRNRIEASILAPIADQVEQDA